MLVTRYHAWIRVKPPFLLKLLACIQISGTSPSESGNFEKSQKNVSGIKDEKKLVSQFGHALLIKMSLKNTKLERREKDTESQYRRRSVMIMLIVQCK